MTRPSKTVSRNQDLSVGLHVVCKLYEKLVDWWTQAANSVSVLNPDPVRYIAWTIMTSDGPSRFHSVAEFLSLHQKLVLSTQSLSRLHCGSPRSTRDVDICSSVYCVMSAFWWTMQNQDRCVEIASALCQLLGDGVAALERDWGYMDIKSWTARQLGQMTSRSILYRQADLASGEPAASWPLIRAGEDHGGCCTDVRRPTASKSV